MTSLALLDHNEWRRQVTTRQQYSETEGQGEKSVPLGQITH